MPNITIREYNPNTGALIGNITALSFGRVAAGTTSPIKVIDFAFANVSSVSNVKLGITSSSRLIVNPDPTGVIADGSAENGFFGIEHTTSFDPSVASGPLTRHFAGVNEDQTAGNGNNVLIGNRSATLSSFVYLDIELGANNFGTAGGTYRVFFDFE